MIDEVINKESNLNNKILNSTSKYENDLKIIINKMKQKSHNLLTGYQTSFDSVYSKLSDKLQVSLSSSINSFSKVFNYDQFEVLFDNYFNKQFQKKLDEITSMHDSLLDSTMSNLNNLIRFIETIDITTNISISSSFLEKNAESIFDSWLLAKIDYNKNKIDFSHHKFNDFFQSYLGNFKEIKMTQLSINNEANREKDITFLTKQSENLEKVSISKCRDVDPYFAFCSEICFFPNMKKLYLEDCYMNQVYIVKYIPSLTKLIINKPPIIQWNSKFFPSTLIKLTITKGFIETDDFNKIISFIINDKQICSSIQYISFKCNIITSLNFNQLMASHGDKKFNSLTELYFDNNNIYCFELDSKHFPKLKILSLIENNIARLNQLIHDLDHNTLVFTNKNMYLFEKKDSMELYNRLKNQLPDYDYSIKEFNLTTVFTKYNKYLLNQLTLHSSMKLSLQELNLSYCGLDTDTIIDFFTTNKSFFNLRKINLKANFIKINFFQLFIQKELNFYYTRLEELILSNNIIEDEDFYLIYDFIDKNSNLKQINLCFNPFSLNYRDQKISPQYEGQLFVFENIENEVKRPYDLIAFLRKLEVIPKRKVDIDFHTLTKTMMCTSLMKRKNFCSKIIPASII